MTKTQKAGPWIMGALLAFAVLVAFAALILIPVWLKPPLSKADLSAVPAGEKRVALQQAQGQLQNNIRTTLLQGLAGIVVVAGAVATWRQVRISREGQITDRLTRAVDQLGSKNVDVRLGGIYALERIAKNSVADRRTIQFQLGAFVRNHARWPDIQDQQHPTATVDEHLSWLQVRAPDVQAAMEALGDRPPAAEDWQLYLSRVDLRSLQLQGGRLAGAQMRYVNLARAWLQEAQLDRCDFKATDLRQANLRGAQLTKANLSSAYLQGANLRRANLSDADLRGTNLSDAILDNAVLTGARANDATIWPDGVDAEKRRELGIIEVAGESGEPAGIQGPQR
jgi:Pentapeptide repeats (8 copies)